jgi:hypothetical protein
MTHTFCLGRSRRCRLPAVLVQLLQLSLQRRSVRQPSSSSLQVRLQRRLAVCHGLRRHLRHPLHQFLLLRAERLPMATGNQAVCSGQGQWVSTCMCLYASACGEAVACAVLWLMLWVVQPLLACAPSMQEAAPGS